MLISWFIQLFFSVVFYPPHFNTFIAISANSLGIVMLARFLMVSQNAILVAYLSSFSVLGILQVCPRDASIRILSIKLNSNLVASYFVVIV